MSLNKSLLALFSFLLLLVTPAIGQDAGLESLAAWILIGS